MVFSRSDTPDLSGSNIHRRRDAFGKTGVLNGARARGETAAEIVFRALADEAGALKQKTEAIKDEAIRRGLRKAEGEFWKLSLSPPGQSNRTDKARLLQVLGISESEFVARFCSPAQTDWRMTCTPRKPLRTAEQPAGPHRTVALRKLLQAKDAAVRAVAIPD